MPKTDFNDRMLSLGLARVSEAAALASARLIGRGDEKAADQAAVNAMRDQLNLLDIAGTVVIGEGERDEAPMLFIGEKVGTGNGPEVDIALDPLEGTTLTAKDMPNALTVIAMGPRGSMLHAPDVYMDKLAVGPGLRRGVVTMDMEPGERVNALAAAKGCSTSDITVCVLERPRHEAMIEALRSTGCAIRLITDGDVAGIIHCAEASTGIDMYMGSGGAPEGVLAAAALKCMGGQMFGTAHVPRRRRARTREEGGDHQPRPRLYPRRPRDRRRDLRGDRRDRRLDRRWDQARGRLPDGRDDFDAIQDRLGAPDDVPEPGLSADGDALPAWLGVERSATGRRWTGLDAAQDRAAEAIAQTGLPHLLARHLARRGVAAADVEGFLAPRLRDLLPDPMLLRDTGIAADRLLVAVAGGQRVAIFADYDVDGAASAALLSGWLRAQGLAATLYVPDRIEEGYGPNAPAIAALARDHDLIVCVDCGTVSHDALAAADVTDVIVLDHHLGAETLPAVLAVVNPNRQDEDGALGHLCAAGVVFLVLVEANRRSRARGRAAPDLIAMLDLVALATVADVAPLVGVNRAFVRQGLTVLRGRARPGLVALADVAGMDGPPTAYHLGYLLGPRINAGGRIGAADLGARLLATDDPGEAAGLAERLDALNRERRTIEAGVTEAALEQAAGRDGPLAWAAGDGWHPGVVGIVASRLKEATGRPSVVVGLRPDGTGQGSARSVAGIDIGAAMQRLAAEGLLLRGGGHAMAAGLTVAAGGLEAAMDRLGELLARQGAGTARPRDLHIDATAMPGAANAELVAALDRAGPFGQGASAPRLAFPSMRAVHARPVGDGHLKATFTDGGPVRLETIAFRAAGSGLAAAVERAAGGPLHLAGRLEINRWQGRETVQLSLEDVAEQGS